jgi:acetolactate synthase I/II/III large subunit
VPRPNFGKGALQDGSAQNLNIVGMASHITKLALQVCEPSNAPALLRRAIATALSGRQGPVLLTLPMDSTLATMAPPLISLEASTSLGIDPQTIALAARALAASRRTLIFAGSGVRRGDGPRQLRAFAERLQCPVVTTPKAKGVFPEDHPLALGVFGIGGHPSATEYLEGGIDTLVGIGSSFGEMATNGWSPLLRPRRHFLQVDIEARMIGRAYPVTLGIAASAESFLRRMTEALPAMPRRRFAVRCHTDATQLLDGPEGRIAPQRAIWEIQQVLPPDTIFACDMGEHSVFATHYLQSRQPDAFMLMNGLGSMGCSIGASIGAQLANPGRPVASIIGDGCFAMYASEVATLVAEKLPVRMFVINDHRLGMVEIGHFATYRRSPTYPTEPMDVARLAQSMGARTLVVERAGELLAARDLFRHPGPIVVDVRIDRTLKMPRKDRFSTPGPKALN